MVGAKKISDRHSNGGRGFLAGLSIGVRVNLLIALAFGALAALGGSYLAGERRLDASLERLMERDAARELGQRVGTVRQLVGDLREAHDRSGHELREKRNEQRNVER